LVECQQMTCCAGVSEFYRRHKLAAGDRLGWFEALNGGRKKLIAFFVADCRGAIFSIRKSQVGSSGRRAMTITAFEIHEGAIRPAADRLHVSGVIAFDRGRIAYRDAGDGAWRRELGMHRLKAIYVRDIPRMRKTAL